MYHHPLFPLSSLCLAYILSPFVLPRCLLQPNVELTHIQDRYLRRLIDKLPEVVLGSRADNTTLTYLNSFKRWRFWASKFPEITVLPAAPTYVALYLLSVLQASTSPSPVQSALYSIHWVHDIPGLESPTSHTLPQKVLESTRGGCPTRHPKNYL